MKESLDKYKLIVPLIQDLQNQSLKPRHWQEIWNTAGGPFPNNDNFTVQNLLDANILKFKKEINEISGSATQEAALETNMIKIKQGWDSREFNLNPYKKGEDVLILGSVEDILIQLEDDQVALATMSASRFAKIIQGVSIVRVRRVLTHVIPTLAYHRMAVEDFALFSSIGCLA